MVIDPEEKEFPEIDAKKAQEDMNALQKRVEEGLEALTWSEAEAPRDARPGAKFYRGINENAATKAAFSGVTVVSWTSSQGLRDARHYEGAAMSEEPLVMMHLTGEIAKKAYEVAKCAVHAKKESK